MTNQYSYDLSLNILKALGGDMTVQYENTDQIWAAIDEIYAASGDGLDLQALVLNITENGTYDYNITDEVDAYVPVNITVDIKQKYTDEQVEDLKDTAREEGYTSGYDKGIADGYVQGETAGYSDGYSEGLEDGAEDQKALLEEITIIDNGVYEKEDGYNKVTVEVPIPTFETESLTKTLKTNGTYNYTPTTDGFSDVNITVEVASSGGLSVPFEEIGYSSEMKNELNDGLNSKPFSDLEYSKSLYNAWDPNTAYASSKYSGDRKLVYCPLIDTSNVINMNYMFRYCSSLTTIPLINTYNVTNMSYLFSGCSSLTSIPQLNTSKVTTMSSMFNDCSSLTTIPLINTYNVTSMNNMFDGCSSLTSIPQLNTSKVTSMSNMFYSCSSLTSIPQLNTSNVTTMSYMFYGCDSLTTIPKLYCGKISSGSNINIFSSSTLNNLTYLGGFEDLGKVSGFSKPSYFLKNCKYLTKESVMNVINNLYDRAAAGYSVVTLPFSSNSLALLSNEEKAIATNKGWTLATS